MRKMIFYEKNSIQPNVNANCSKIAKKNPNKMCEFMNFPDTERVDGNSYINSDLFRQAP